MGFEMYGRRIDQIGVVGTGRMGLDIALHFAKEGARAGVEITLVGHTTDAASAAESALFGKIDKTVESRRLRPDVAEKVKNCVRFTPEMSDLAGAGLVIEAISEDPASKKAAFKALESIVGDDAIVASCSSHLEPETLFNEVTKPDRCLNLHFFYPADRNQIVEVVPGPSTSAEVSTFCKGFLEQVGKVPIQTGSRFGFALNPIHEGLFLAAAECVEQGLCSVKEADVIAAKALGMKIGPFTTMNLNGGTPLAAKGLAGYQKKGLPWFRVPPLVEKQVASGEPWPVAAKGETVDIAEDKEKEVADLLLGAFFGLCSEVVDAGVTTVADLDMAVELGLAMKGPFRLMNKMVPRFALMLADAYASRNPGFKVSEVLRRQSEAEVPFDIPVVLREDRDGVAVVTIRRPRVLNALNGEVLTQIKDIFDEIRQDDSVKAVVLTGFGTKAFVSGADINEIAAVKDAAGGVAFALRGQNVLNRIESLKKPVIAAMNGLAFGGGSEISMACHARLAAAGQKVFLGQPEPKLGVIPGYGGTQRLVRWIGFENAWPLLRHGNPIGSAQALEFGLILEEVARPELLDRAIALARDAADGERSLDPIPTEPVPVPDAPDEVDIGHLSKRIDKIVQEATIDGAKVTLAEGLEIEAAKFGECFETKDARIGLENFLKNGPKAAAEFIHE